MNPTWIAIITLCALLNAAAVAYLVWDEWKRND